MTVTLQEAPDLVAVPHSTRLRCQECHRFVGTDGSPEIVDIRCGVRYVLTDGAYVRLAA